MRIRTGVLVIVSLASSLAACVETTTGIWKHPTYSEAISQFLTTEDNRQLIFIGKDYHYIFPDTSSLFEILNWKDRGFLRVHFSEPFHVDSQNIVTGVYAIDCQCWGITSDQVKWLEQRGFKRGAEIEGTIALRKEGDIVGTRYASGGIQLPNISTLNTSYEIQIETDFSNAGVAGRIALTPIAVAEDGVATVGLGYLLLIGAPFAIVNMVINGHGL
jgi:hypothetical protein